MAFTSAGEHQLYCSAGISEAWQWWPYYEFHPNIYHTSRSCCTGYGLSFTAVVPGES